MKNFEQNAKVQERARKVFPLGVNSNFRYWGEGITPYIKRGKGSHIWDVGGNEYIDYRMAFGPIILGHSYDEVDDVVAAEIRNGLLAAMTSELEIEVGEMMVEMCPGIDMVRFACSGTEATMHAIRIARAYTGRELIVKFEGNYHGFHDHTLWSTYAPVESYGNKRNPIPVAASSGILKSLGEKIITLPFNDFDGFERVMRSYGEQIAAVISEPCQGNCGAILPLPGFLELIRKKTEEYGIVFILDEVKTGFRIANGGAQEYYNLKPDMATYAKALGNGYPLAAIGGKAEIMQIIGHGVSQGGTYTNNKPGVAGAYATLKLLKEKNIIETINQRGGMLMDGLKKIFAEAGMSAVFNGYPGMFSFAFTEEKITNQREWSETNKDLYLLLMEKAIDLGVMPDYDPREPWFLCYSHSEEDINKTLDVFSQIVKTL
jgi:glutamate-1-semialdehyde 2,1-aminomutase